MFEGTNTSTLTWILCLGPIMDRLEKDLNLPGIDLCGGAAVIFRSFYKCNFGFLFQLITAYKIVMERKDFTFLN